MQTKRKMRTQKTGFYFDQRENRQVLASFCKGKRVLDAYCYSGGFGIAAGRAGAAQVVFADSSVPALDLARANAEQNRLSDRSVFIHGDAVELLEKGRSEKPFDVISIDPPAYARSKKNLMVALNTRGNAKLEDRGVRLVAEIAGCDRSAAEHWLAAAAGQVQIAVLMARLELDAPSARTCLEKHGGSLRAALGE